MHAAMGNNADGKAATLRERVVGAIEHAIEEGLAPGAVAAIGRGDETLCHVAVGRRMIAPEERPMLPDTVFDLASLTKPIATATAVMRLVEAGSVALDDPVHRFLPAFRGDGRERATVRHLLTHSSGLPAYVNYLQLFGDDVPPAERRERMLEDMCTLEPVNAPGEGFEYACLGYIVLASIVQIAGGRPLDETAREGIFEPLGMTDTRFNPPEEMAARCAATEQLDDHVLCGVVHDENARYLGGVGGNAGLFSTAPDLARYVRMVLGGGELDGVRILAAESVERMTTPQLHLDDAERAVGWDIASSYTPQVRGGFPEGGIGHSGYTGTSAWVDPPSGAWVILLTNRVHLGRDVEIAPLRREIASIAADMLLR